VALLKKIMAGMASQRQDEQRNQLFRNLMRHEARIGGELFGEVPKNRRREFFCLDEHSWVWHEEWIDESGEQHVVMTRYDIRPDGILKSQNGSHYQKVSKEEATRLARTAELYAERVKNEVYSFV
jgi:hypothetical protein